MSLPHKRKYKEEDCEYNSDGEPPRRGSDVGRHDNSLGVLTKKFVNLIQNAEGKCIDLNDAVNMLGV